MHCGYTYIGHTNYQLYFILSKKKKVTYPASFQSDKASFAHLSNQFHSVRTSFVYFFNVALHRTWHYTKGRDSNGSKTRYGACTPIVQDYRTLLPWTWPIVILCVLKNSLNYSYGHLTWSQG